MKDELEIEAHILPVCESKFEYLGYPCAVLLICYTTHILIHVLVLLWAEVFAEMRIGERKENCEENSDGKINHL